MENATAFKECDRQFILSEVLALLGPKQQVEDICESLGLCVHKTPMFDLNNQSQVQVADGKEFYLHCSKRGIFEGQVVCF